MSDSEVEVDPRLRIAGFLGKQTRGLCADVVNQKQVTILTEVRVVVLERNLPKFDRLENSWSQFFKLFTLQSSVWFVVSDYFHIASSMFSS